MRLLVINIGTIVGIDTAARTRISGAEMDSMERIDNGWLTAEDGVITAFGSMDSCPSGEGFEVLDAMGGMLFPSYCDSHTHIVYAGSREQEFVDKIHGLTYEQIAQRGGGILALLANALQVLTVLLVAVHLLTDFGNGCLVL